MKRAIHLCALTLLIWLGDSAVVSAEEHRLVLRRPVEPGQSFHYATAVALKNSLRSSFALRAMPGREEQWGMELRGRLTVEAVDEQGWPQILNIEPENGTYAKHGEGELRLPADITIQIVRESARARVTVNGQAPEPPWARALNLIREARPPEFNEESVFGFGVTRAVGAQWDIQADELLESLRNQQRTADSPSTNLNFDAAEATGSVRFEEVKSAGVPRALVKISFEVRNVVMLIPGDLPPLRSVLSTEIELELPLDETLPVHRRKQSNRLHGLNIPDEALPDFYMELQNEVTIYTSLQPWSE